MTKVATLMLAALLGLAGCAQMTERGAVSEPSEKGFDASIYPAPLPRAPVVHVVKGYLVVNQEPIRLWSSDYDPNKRTTIGWQLPGAGNYAWPSKGAITFKPKDPPGLICLTLFRLLSCSFDHEPKAQYKYTLTALDNGRPLPALDPVIINME